MKNQLIEIVFLDSVVVLYACSPRQSREDSKKLKGCDYLLKNMRELEGLATLTALLRFNCIGGIMKDTEIPACTECKDEHYKLHGCCNGHECGCRAEPVLITNCKTCNPAGDKPMPDYVKKYAKYIEYENSSLDYPPTDTRNTN